MLDVITLNAYADTASGQGAQDPFTFITFMPLVIIFVIFYVLLIRPQQKRVKEHKSMIDSLDRGDKVVTAGGIIGTIARVEADDTFIVEIAPDIKVKVLKSMISDVMNRTSNPGNDNKKEEKNTKAKS